MPRLRPPSRQSTLAFSPFLCLLLAHALRESRGRKDPAGVIWTCQGPFVGNEGTWTKASGGSSGTGNVVASPQFALFYQPTTGTVATAQGDPHVTTDGARNVTGVSFKALAIGGQRYSGPYGGSRWRWAANQNVITDPTDAITSTAYTFSSPPPGIPAHFVWTDNRQLNNTGIQEVIQDWGFLRGSSFSGDTAGHAINCMIKRPANISNTTLSYCLDDQFMDTAPGLNVGGFAVLPIGNTQWDVSIAGNHNILRHGGGITEADTGNIVHTGDGDTAGIRFTTTSWGGEVDAAGEGNEAVTGGATESSSQFTAVISTGGSLGSTQLKLTTPTGCVFGAGPNAAFCSLGVGRPLVDITQGPTANTVTNLAATGLGTGLRDMTVGTPIAAASNAWGTLAANVQPNGSDMSGPPYFTSLTFNVNVTSGTFVVNTPICFASQQWDVGYVTAVSGSGPVTITANVYKPHASGSVIMQGGPCGQGFEVVGETVGTNTYLGYVVGATSTSVLEVTWFVTTGPSINAFNTGLFTSGLLYGNSSVTGISSSGTAVYFTGAANGTLQYNNVSLNKQGIIFSAASDSALNGTACTNVTWLSTSAGTCTMAGLTGVHSATTATYVLASGAGAPLANINLWNIAHIVDVQDGGHRLRP